MKTTLTFAMRLYRIDQILQEKGAVSFESLHRSLLCSEPTLKRDIRYMREKLGAPIIYDRVRNVYYYEKGSEKARKRAMQPSVARAWFTPNEMFSLLAALQLFSRIEGDSGAVTARDMPALKSRLLALLPEDLVQAKELLKRVKVVTPSVRVIDAPYFGVVGIALARRLRLRITYFTRTRSKENAREISPLRLVNWRGRWYLDAWCHETAKLKTFAVENIRFAEILDVHCRVVAMRDIEKTLDSTYGIFSGGEQKTAVIKIDSVLTPYEISSVWHPKQTVQKHEDGTMTLSVPYANETEIAGEIMRLGQHARVVSPQSLIDYLQQQYRAALAQYDDSEEHR